MKAQGYHSIGKPKMNYFLIVLDYTLFASHGPIEVTEFTTVMRNTITFSLAIPVFWACVYQVQYKVRGSRPKFFPQVSVQPLYLKISISQAL